MPDIPWPAALALVAVVAPPDAVSASAVARRIGLPRRIVTVLEGESLLNDATALVSLRTAIAAITGAVGLSSISLDFLIAAGGGALIGHKAPVVQASGSRITERTTWTTVAFLLEHAVFLLIDLQVVSIVTGLDVTVAWSRVVLVCAGVLAAVIVTRMAWVLLTHWLRGLRAAPADREPWSHAILTGWAGMRRVVTIAAVFIIPADVPHHDLLVLSALVVMLGPPHCDWLPEAVCLDERGFVLTGPDIPTEHWQGDVPPAQLSTAVPGVLCAGDVRAGSMKRVASATGEGAAAVSLIHEHLSALPERR